MQLIDGQPVYSATDLVGYLYCEHLTQLGRAALAGLVPKPVRDDPELELIRKRGFDHEHRYLESLRADGRQVMEIQPDGYDADRIGWLRESAARTEAAIRGGDDVIYQATFFDGRWRGHADFLKRVDQASDLGPWSYEVADTKLARSARAGHLLQLCTYTDMLFRIQGVWPEWMEVALGGSARAAERFRASDHMAYYRAVKARFDQVVDDADPPAYPPSSTYPDPVEHCDVCAWLLDCLARRRRDDHLSLVANITRRQRKALVGRGVTTLEALGTLPLPVRPRLEGTSRDALERVREQARLQLQARQQARDLFELLKPVEAGRGLALLPTPSPGDLFFDIEGDPFVEDGGADGLEYLFGVIEPGDGLGLEPAFHAFWGLDRASERAAFESLMDLVMDRLATDPGLHVYHYGAYEPSAVKRLMGRHATREEEVDRLLRGGVFVDLLSVVRQGVRVSQESYSIKRLEPYYALERKVALKDAGSSIINFELWLESEGRRQDLLDLIRDYNRDDCLSNWRLREWLEQRRIQAAREFGVDVPRPGPRGDAAPPAVSERQARVSALVERLTSGLPRDAERDEPEQATWLLAQLLDWHRREDKAFWWQYFAHLRMTDEQLIEDSGAAIGGLEYEGVVEEIKQSYVHRYRFPPQDNDIRAGTRVRDPRTEASPGDVVAVDQLAGIVDLKRGRKSPVEHPRAIIPADHYPDDEQRDALLRLGEWVAENGIDAPGRHRAERDLLLRRPPTAGQAEGEPLRRDDESELAAAKRLVLAMDRSCLAIQGPPGSGKTFTGARMIVEVVRAGRKVGITATSHKVIGNLLDEVCRAAETAGVDLAAIQRASEEQRCDSPIVTLAANNDEVVATLASGAAKVAAGTAWVWSDDKLMDTVDVLFVDEAGQISLANVLAVAQAARSVVLLGDPQQLEQPLQGSHPPGADASSLEHLLGHHRTMPPGRGLFLEHTWRLHPALARYTSEVFYEDRLGSAPVTARQAFHGTRELTGTGIRWIPVQHEGNHNESSEEVDVVGRLAESLIGTRWTDGDGVERTVGWRDILIVAPYNAQVAAIAHRLPEARVGTVDRFQGQEAAVAIYSMTTSSPDLAPRGVEFLYSLNRLNVATSRARCMAVIVASPDLLKVNVHTPRQMQLANGLCRAAEVATEQSSRVDQPLVIG